jgi:nucleotide-binding universal stress UspA family protein
MFAKILVPQDFTNLARRPLELAKGLAALTHGEVVVLAVVDDSFPYPDVFSLQMPWADFHRHLRDTATQKLNALVEEVNVGGAKVQVVRGKPAAKIVEYAAQERCDLIVMATHGTRGLRQALLGSVARRVVHEAPCPVLLLRLPAEEGGEPS